MRLPVRSPSAALALVAILAFACGGAGPSLDDVPTATLPNPLPEPLIVGEVSPPVVGFSYTVQSGDNLAVIAERFDTTAEAIAQASGIGDPTRLEIGQVLTIPGVAPDVVDVLSATEPPPPPPPPEPGDENTYTVESGDIAADIAAAFGVTLQQLAEANSTTVDALRDLAVGDVLIIPTSFTPTPDLTAP